MYPLVKIVLEEAASKVLQLKSCRTMQPCQIHLQCKNNIFARDYSESKNEIQKKEQNNEIENNKNMNQIVEKEQFFSLKKKLDLTPLLPPNENFPNLKYWNEEYRIRRAKREIKKLSKMKSMPDYFKKLANIRHFLPKNFTEIPFFFKMRKLKKQIIDQMYLPERRAVLKPDLAAAHFIIKRGGSIKFVDKEWMSFKEAAQLLPIEYVPTYLVEGINAENTFLIKEGLANLTDLRYIKWLSLKNLDSVNDWFMDWISKEYHETLEHLDISNCKKVTHRGLSCFYRFEKLKTLKVEGISDSPEFKVACLMLLDIFPHLEIIGINLEIPQKIEPIEEDIKEIKGESVKQLKI